MKCGQPMLVADSDIGAALKKKADDFGMPGQRSDDECAREALFIEGKGGT